MGVRFRDVGARNSSPSRYDAASCIVTSKQYSAVDMVAPPYLPGLWRNYFDHLGKEGSVDEVRMYWMMVAAEIRKGYSYKDAVEERYRKGDCSPELVRNNDSFFSLFSLTITHQQWSWGVKLAEDLGDYGVPFGKKAPADDPNFLRRIFDPPVQPATGVVRGQVLTKAPTRTIDPRVRACGREVKAPSIATLPRVTALSGTVRPTQTQSPTNSSISYGTTTHTSMPSLASASSNSTSSAGNSSELQGRAPRSESVSSSGEEDQLPGEGVITPDPVRLATSILDRVRKIVANIVDNDQRRTEPQGATPDWEFMVREPEAQGHAPSDASESVNLYAGLSSPSISSSPVTNSPIYHPGTANPSARVGVMEAVPVPHRHQHPERSFDKENRVPSPGSSAPPRKKARARNAQVKNVRGEPVDELELARLVSSIDHTGQWKLRNPPPCTRAMARRARRVLDEMRA